jgi:hypothetical protein
MSKATSSKFHNDVKAELEELLGNMPSIEQAIEDIVGSSEAEDWGKGGETRQNDGRVNDVVFHMLMEAFPQSWLKWSGDEIQAEDQERHEVAVSVLTRVLSDLGAVLSNTEFTHRQRALTAFYDAPSRQVAVEAEEEGFY